VGHNIASKALSTDFIGFLGAILSAIACVLSRFFSRVAAKVGKGPVMAVGAIAFFLIGFLSKWAGDTSEWGWKVVVFYILMGVGRAVYESTNKAIFADFFRWDESAGAFANVFVFGTTASCVAFVLEAFQADKAILYLLLFSAALTMPGFLICCLIRHMHRTVSNRTSASGC